MISLARVLIQNPEAIAIGVICFVLGAGNLAADCSMQRHRLHLGVHEMLLGAPRPVMPVLPRVPEMPSAPLEF